MQEGRARVAQLIPWLSLGGATGLVIGLAERLRADGYDVELVTGEQTEAGISMAGLAESLGIPVHVIPTFRRDPSPANDLLALRELTGLLREREFDIVHAHGTKALLLGTWAARRAKIQPTVWHIHGWGFHDHSSSLSRALVVWSHRLMARTASRVAAVSEATKKLGIEARIGSPDDYRVVYEAVDFDRFSEPPMSMEAAKRRLDIDPDRLVVGTLTRLAAQKAPLDFVDAAALVLKEMPEACFLLVGDGPLKDAVEARVRQHGVQGGIRTPGARWDTPELLAAFDVFALSSLWEGFPICYLEAMAMGKPVVGTDAGGASEAVLDGETGFVVPPRQPELLAERILTLLRDAGLRERMGAAGRVHAAQYGYDRLMRDVSALYQELLNGGARV